MRGVSSPLAGGRVSMLSTLRRGCSASKGLMATATHIPTKLMKAQGQLTANQNVNLSTDRLQDHGRQGWVWHPLDQLVRYPVRL
jgi:hypothetical protein